VRERKRESRSRGGGLEGEADSLLSKAPNARLHPRDHALS